MNRFIFTDESVKELARCATILYKTFNSANKTLVENPTRSLSSDFALDYALTKWKWFYFMYEDKQVAIYKFPRKYVYSLECYGFIPSADRLFSDNSEFELYKHLFGRFEDIDSAVSAFNSAVHQIIGM